MGRITERKEIYNRDIAPVVAELKRLCKRHGIPMFFSACYYTGELPETKDMPKDENIVPIRNGPEYYSEFIHDFVSPHTVGVRMQPDYIADCIKVINGFRTVGSEEDTMDMSEFDIPDEDYFDPTEHK